MKLVDKMKDENLGLAILYNFTKGYGHVPMNVYDVVLPLLYHDGFRNHLFEGVEVEEALTKCVQEDTSFIQTILDAIEEDKEMTSRALGICLLNKYLSFEFEDNEMKGIYHESSILDINEAINLGKFFSGKSYEDILNILKKKSSSVVFLDSVCLGDDVDLHEIARTTAGFVGADLENLMNEAAIQAARDDRAYIMKEDIDKSFIKVGIGTEKKSRVVPESERRITAYHESGHAILFHLLPDVGPVYTVSIIPTGTGAAGYTMPLPENDNVFMTRGKMIQDIMVSLGGRIAEELILDDITTGASQDIKQVTQYARAMVTKFGMSDELGLINYDSGEGDEVFLGKEIGQQRPYGENTQTVIDQEVKKIVNKCYKDAKAMIEEHIDVLHKCAALLLEKERINRAEFEALFEPETEVETQA